MILSKILLITTFNNLFLNIIIIVFAIFATSFFDSTKIYLKIIKGIIMGLFAALLMLNPIRLENGVYYDGKIVLFTILGFFSGITSIISALVVTLPLRYVINDNGNHLVSVYLMISSGFIGYIFSFYFKKIKNITYKRISYAATILFINVVNIIIFLSLATTNLTFNNLILPFLIIFPLTTIFSSYIYLYNIGYNQVIRSNKFYKNILYNALDINKNHGYITVNKNYEYILFNNAHKDYVKEIFKTDVNIGDCYLNVYKKYNIKNDIKEKIDTAFLGISIEQKLTFDNRIIKQKYTPIFDKDKIIAVNILSRDITKEIKFEKELLELSLTDPLTGFSNRRSYHQMLINYNDNNFSIIYVDIDGLKFMNDAFGHSEGDKLINIVADVIKSQTKNIEKEVFRLGGDEFIILIKNKELNDINKLANQIKNKLNKLTLNELNISVSIGTAIQENSDELLKEVIKRAEKSMYDNKIIYNKRHPFKNVENLLNILYKRDNKLKTHLNNVSNYSNKLGEALNFDSYNLELLNSLSKLHDIGKVNVNEKLMINPVLTEDESHKLKSHVDTGYRLLSRIPKYFDIAFDLLCQYENYDGTGYSIGIKGKNIPIKSRIIRITNYYDHLTLYVGKSHDEAINFLIEHKGTKFDPNLVDIFVNIMKNDEK